MPPLPSKNWPKKMAAKCGDYISCLLPLSEVSGSATGDITMLEDSNVYSIFSFVKVSEH